MELPVFLIILVGVICESSCVEDSKYAVTQDRLKEIRSDLLYWFSDEGANSDYEKDIRPALPQIEKQLNFNLPFYGFTYNYIRVSMHGYLEFTDGPAIYNDYPLVFPRNYPTEKDPSFIGPFYSKMAVGNIGPEDEDKRRSGVYYRVEYNLTERVDQFGIDLRERLTKDIREGKVIGADTFTPKHCIITTWKNMSFMGGIDKSKYVTNTFQVVLATDEVHTYAIFNYGNIQWTTHTEAGGDSAWGEGGVPAFVGFNAGHGKRAFEYIPYSQRFTIKDLTWTGCANGFKGRHMFRIDSKIMPGTCSNNMNYICTLYMDKKNQGTTPYRMFTRQ